MFRQGQRVNLFNSSIHSEVREATVEACVCNDAYVRVDGDLMTFDRVTGLCHEYKWLSIKEKESTFPAGSRLASLWSMSNNPDMTDKEFRDLATIELLNIIQLLDEESK